MQRLLPSQPRCQFVTGGFVRLISPLLVTRVCALLLGLSVSLPIDGGIRSEGYAQEIQRQVAAASRRPRRRAVVGPARLFRVRIPGPESSTGAGPRRRARPAKSQRMQALRSLQEAMTPRYKTDANGERVPDIRAAAAIIFNPANGQVLWQENAQDKRSIASITKVMTAVVFLEDNPDLDAGRHRRTRRRLRRLDDVPQGQRPAASSATCCT